MRKSLLPSGQFSASGGAQSSCHCQTVCVCLCVYNTFTLHSKCFSLASLFLDVVSNSMPHFGRILKQNYMNYNFRMHCDKL